MLKRFALPLWLLYTTALTILSLVSLGKMPSLGSSLDDKIYHAIAYFLFTILGYNYLRTKQKANSLFLLATIAVLYGIIIEALQHICSTQRVTDFYDVVANCLGIGIAILVIRIKKLKLN